MRTDTFAGFTEELEKISARRGLKEIAKALKGGNLERAHSLAKTPGVLKSSPAGSQIRDLGMGSEGLATSSTAQIRRRMEGRCITQSTFLAQAQKSQLRHTHS